MRFDWYQGSFPEASPEDVIGMCLEALPEVQQAPWRGSTNGYAHGVSFLHAQKQVGGVLFGGNGGAPVNALVSGGHAPVFAQVVRARFPQHYVTRVDVAEDYDDPKAFDALYRIVHGIALRQGIDTNNVGDWDRGVKGRTYYVGSKKSPARLRLYEKGKQEGYELRPDWVRLELQYRVQKANRERLAHEPPAAAYGAAQWARSVYRAVTGLDVTKLDSAYQPPGEDEQQLLWLVRQYGPLLERRKAALGCWFAVGAELGSMRAEWVAQQLHGFTPVSDAN